MLSYFDIETTGLDLTKDTFRCAVAADDAGVHAFTDIDEFLKYILKTDATFVTFNGAAFDFPFLAAKLPDIWQRAKLAQLAAQSIDIMFDFVCDNGYRCSLNSLAEPLGGAKTGEGGWAATCEDLGQLVEYCKADVALLKLVYEAGEQNMFLKRVTQKGKEHVWTLARPFRTVKVALEQITTAPPDQSWQTDPMDLHNAVTWIETALLAAVA
jgi:hypothetical protein